MTLTDEIVSKLGTTYHNLTYRESENRRAYEFHALMGAVGDSKPVSDSHTKTTYNESQLPSKFMLDEARDTVAQLLEMHRILVNNGVTGCDNMNLAQMKAKAKSLNLLAVRPYDCC